MEYNNPLPLLKAFRLRPQKDLGQNFLVDENILSRIVECADLAPTAQVLEIGAGLGSLTYFLAQAASQVTAVEIDPDLLAIARHTTANCENVDLVQGDILQMDLSNLELQDGFIVVANIPYYITSAIIRKLLNSAAKPVRMVLTIQEEVARRICAEAGEMSLLALSVQVFGDAHIVLKIPAQAFYPSPKVDSVTLRVDLFQQPLIAEEKLDTFFRLTKAGFSQKRKMLRNTLSAGLQLPREEVDALLTDAAIDPQRRAQTLTLQEWGTLTDHYLAAV
jgi:16S rRNA (adenine1518-N6/adenine1519-N6)-dimethyltransferase